METCGCELLCHRVVATEQYHDSSAELSAECQLPKVPTVTENGLCNNNNNIYLLQLGCYQVTVVILHCKQYMKLVTTKFKSGGLHEEQVVATWNLGNQDTVVLTFITGFRNGEYS